MKEAQNYVFTTQNLYDFILTSKVRNALGLGRIHLPDECARPCLPQPAVHIRDLWARNQSHFK